MYIYTGVLPWKPRAFTIDVVLTTATPFSYFMAFLLTQKLIRRNEQRAMSNVLCFIIYNKLKVENLELRVMISFED